MTTEQFIEKAKEGGWKLHLQGGTDTEKFIHQMLLDPEVWKAVYKDTPLGTTISFMSGWSRSRINMPIWQYKMHKMIDHLVDGGTIESYLKTL